MSAKNTGGDGTVKVAAAVDFGTHGTGFAWALIEPLNDEPEHRRIKYSDDRLARDHLSQAKNLSAVLTNSAAEVVEWGFQARHDWIDKLERGRTHGWGYATGYKMALRADTGALGVAQARGSADVSRLDSVRKLVVGCLSRVRAAAEREITAAGPLAHEIRWCVTVPAIWDEDDRQFMREAAVDAGFPNDPDRLLLAIEPEAAAITGYLRLWSLIDGTGRKEQVPLTSAGTRFMVVDCGGGTIDITAYESLKDDEVQLAETGQACGGRLGSDFLNLAFRTELLADRLGADIVSRLAVEYPRELQRMDDMWENFKVGDLMTESDDDGTVRLADSAVLYLDVPGPIWELLDEGRKRELTTAVGRPYRLVFEAKEVQPLFDALTEPILELVDQQLTAMEEAPRQAGNGGVPHESLLMVGGFSRCGLLRDRVHQRFGSRIRVLYPEHQAPAVLTGAVHIAYDPGMVVSRLARHTYGIELATPWEEEDGASRRTVVDGVAMCEERFKVLVNRGQAVQIDESAEMSVAPLTRRSKRMAIRFFRTMAARPRYVDDSGCEQIATILVPLRRHHRKSEDGFTLKFYFGKSQIEVEAIDDKTGESTRGTVDFRRMH
ncbi:hypothetical protein ACWEFL_08455 [Streptomyces sp. NPDC004838]